ncbi:HlyD family secretion protein [Fundidesulfovibrio butyratiphilus]
MPASAPLGTGRPRFLLTPTPRIKKRLLYAAAAVAVLGAGFWGYSRLSHVTENDARVMADMVTLSSRVDGWVHSRPVTDGDRVARGDEIAVIDQRESGFQLEELRAKSQSLRLDAERVKAQIDISQSTTEGAVEAAKARHESALANLRSAQAELERTRLDFERNQRLIKGDIISRQAWDVTRTTTRQIEEKLAQAKAQLSEAKAGLSDALAKRGEVEVLKKEYERLGRDRQQVEAQIRRKEIDFQDRVVKSPIDGVVDQKFVEPGEYVIPGQRLAILHDPKAVWIEAHVKETKLADLKPGQPVSLCVDAYPGRRFSGRVERIGNATTSQFALLPSPNPSGNFTKITQRVPVRISVDQPEDNPLRPGMMVEVDIDAGGKG